MDLKADDRILYSEGKINVSVRFRNVGYLFPGMYDIRRSSVFTGKVDECAFLFVIDIVAISDHNL